MSINAGGNPIAHAVSGTRLSQLTSLQFTVSSVDPGPRHEPDRQVQLVGQS